MSLKIILWVILIVSVTLSLITFCDIVIKIIRHDFGELFGRVAILIAIIGSSAAVIGVMLVKQDMDLKNRPYVYAVTKIINHSGNTFFSETSINNCGNTPAYKVVIAPKLCVNGEGITVTPPESKGFSLYPNSLQYHHFSMVFNPGDNIEYSIDLDYKDSAGKKYHYRGVSKFWDRGSGIYAWKTISSE